MATEWKKREVRELKELLDEHDVFAIVNIDDIPSKQMQQMRGNLRGRARLRVARNTLMKLALGDSEIADYVKGNAGFIFTDMNSFKLYKALEKGKAPAPAKAGEKAPRDIVVEKEDTGFPPGPMIGELQSVGVPAQVKKGSIHVKKDTVVVRRDEVISKKLADILTKLKMEPMEVGLDLVATCEEGMIFESNVLKVDTEQYKGSIVRAYNEAMNLALYAGIADDETITVLIGKAKRVSLSLALELNVVNKDTIKLLLGKAQRNALALSSILK